MASAAISLVQVSLEAVKLAVELGAEVAKEYAKYKESQRKKKLKEANSTAASSAKAVKAASLPTPPVSAGATSSATDEPIFTGNRINL